VCCAERIEPPLTYVSTPATCPAGDLRPGTASVGDERRRLASSVDDGAPAEGLAAEVGTTKVTTEGAERDRWLVKVELAHGVFVTADLLGTTWTTERRFSGDMALPKPPANFEGFGKLPLEPPDIDGAHAVVEWFNKPRDGGRGSVWGNGYKRDNTKAYLRSAMLVLPAVAYETESEGRALLDRVGAEIDAFIHDLHDWLETLGGALQRPRDGESTPRYVHPVTFGLDAAGEVRDLPIMNQMTTSYGAPHEVDASVWRDAFERADRGERPPEEHLLLRDSHLALFGDDRRKAVIDATTAVEVALARGVRDRITAAPDAEAVNRVLKNTSGVVELFDLAVALGVPTLVSRARVLDQLAGPRNLAVHQGVDPEPTVVRRGQQAAQAILRDASPL
jgi:hypothetical protein